MSQELQNRNKKDAQQGVHFKTKIDKVKSSDKATQIKNREAKKADKK